MLKGKVALVTGAGQGIGRAIAVEMARQGASAVAMADRNGDSAGETADLVRAEGAGPRPSSATGATATRSMRW
jgi:NAD(P)-dependent dehydrogenase (short-subunit alcohol dehydrogenase family)